MAKLPDWRRASSSWFNWFAVVPVICDGGCAFIPWWWVETRACRCAGGIADVVGAIGAPPGATAAGGAVGVWPNGPYCDCGVPGIPGEPAGRLDSGEDGPGPPGTAWAGPGAPTPGPVRCAQTGAANASAATIATPLKRCFMTLILRCSSGLAEACPTLIVC